MSGGELKITEKKRVYHKRNWHLHANWTEPISDLKRYLKSSFYKVILEKKYKQFRKKINSGQNFDCHIFLKK
jgi:hypothetical protein